MTPSELQAKLAEFDPGFAGLTAAAALEAAEDGIRDALAQLTGRCRREDPAQRIAVAIAWALHALALLQVLGESPSPVEAAIADVGATANPKALDVAREIIVSRPANVEEIQ